MDYVRNTEIFRCQKVSMVHGQMKPADKEAEMQNALQGKTNIMVATGDRSRS
jgi:ATP-dependent DNA helicase RecG